MQEKLIPLLRCPVTRDPLSLQLISRSTKIYNGRIEEIIWEGILFNEDKRWFYPVIEGIPRLLVEAFLDYGPFLRQHIQGYEQKCDQLQKKHAQLIDHVLKKNKRTKESFKQEWALFNYNEDKTWDANKEEMIQRFFEETAEDSVSVRGKLVFDAGCGNGLLNQLMAEAGITVVGMDLSESIVRAFQINQQSNAMFIQGDIQYPPLAAGSFDIVHCSGVLICTNNTEYSFSCIDPCVKAGGKLSVWLYHPRKDLSHNAFNLVRKFTSKMPIKLQYYLYLVTLFPVSYVAKRMKGNKQNAREMMIDILDWFSPEYRWEHTPNEAAGWFQKRNYGQVRTTTTNIFGFNIIGVKNK
jgi:SAM-dependent methyltransferase/uncharacterized protein YbaR (Trm112 family)